MFGYFLFFWNFPERFYPRRILKPFTKYIRWAGLDNTWSLFAPNPLSENLMVGFELEYSNGVIKPWRAKEFNVVDLEQEIPTIRHVRAHRQLVAIFNKVFSKSVCRYIIRQLSKEELSKQLPIKVHILRFYEPANEATKEITPWLSMRVFTYDVDRNEEEIHQAT